MTTVRALALTLIASLAVACKAHETTPAAPAHPEGEAWLTAAQLESGQIELTQAKVIDLPTEITTSGRITFDDLRVAHVFSPVTGRVAGILAQPGQRVSAGQALAVIDSPDVGAALADLQKARADSTAAAHELQRQHELADAGAGTPRDLEQAEDNAAKAKAEEARAQARMKLLRGAGEGGSERFTLRAPIAGEVIARAVNPGVEVQGQYGGGQAVELFTVGSSDLVWVVADVYEMDLPRVSERAPVRVTVPSFPHDHWDGRIEQIAGALDPTTRTARVRATLKNPRHELRPEMYASVRIEVDKKPLLAIPRRAVLRTGRDLVVFVEIGTSETGVHRFAKRVVEIDEDRGGELVPVLAGLKPGETVVSAGAIQLLGMI